MMMMSRPRVLGVLLGIGSLGVLLSAQQANFTGTVRSLDASDIRSVRFQYDAGARSYWHVHEGSQILVLEKGHGRVQEQGKPVREMVPGQPVFLPAGVPHWHGAAPDEGLTQIAVNLGGVRWMQAVTEQEYSARVSR
jgi:quercetin dioxygenase-like cupin family protein